MSTKFEQLLDLLVNEEMDKANELFHEIVVEKSKTIYENLIAEEDDEEEMDESADSDEEEMDESAESDDEEMDESKEDDEEMDENVELEDSYMMNGETGDDTDDFGGDISADGDNFDAPADDEHGHEGQEDTAIMDIKNAIEELEAAFAELEAAQGGEEAEMGMTDPGFDDDESEDEMDDETMGMPMESRRLREYSEKVGYDWDKNAQKGEHHKMAGAGTGDNEEQGGRNTKSVVSSGKGKPTTGATAKNILSDTSTSEGSNTGTTPNKVNKGIAKDSGEKFASGIHNVDGKKSGIKTVTKQGAGYPGNNKTPGPVGSGTGDKAGQTSVGQVKSPINGAPNRNA
jgi:hypothetical protein